MANTPRTERPGLEGAVGFRAPGGTVALDVLRSMHQVLARVVDLLAGRLSLGSAVHGTHSGRIDGQWLETVTPAVADTTFPVPHDLGRVPVAYFVGGVSAACSLYEATDRVWNDTNQVWFRCDTASVTVRILLV